MKFGSQAVLSLMNQDFAKLERSDVTTYSIWKDQMTCLLTSLKIYYILDPNLPVIPENKDGEDAGRRK